MGKRFLILALILALPVVSSAVELSPGTTLQFRQFEERTARVAADKAGKYSKDYIAAAQANITAARSAIATENEKVALQNIEAGNLQLNIAEMKVVEKELADETALRKEELKKLESRLERYLQGEENVK